MRIRNWSELYSLGYIMVAVGIRSFYKRYQLVGMEKIPKNKPVLFASNHQNAFMDPVIVAVNLSQPTYYMVRADIFKKKLAAKAFAGMNMMPIYRQRDGGDTIKKNEAVFNQCYEILSKNRTIIIYPEGNHDRRKRLRPLKKGVFRIGFGAQDKYSKDLDVYVVPVGVNYSNNRNMRATLLINFGDPIRLNDYWDNYLSEPAPTLNKLMAELPEKMSDLIVDIQNLDFYDTIENAINLFDKEIYELEKTKNNTLLSQFKSKKSFITKLESYIESNPEQAAKLNMEMKEYAKLLQKNGLKSWLFRKEEHDTFLPVLLHVLSFPVHVYGVANNYLPYKIPVWFVENKIKDTQFHSSLKMGVSIFLFPVFWSIQTTIVASFTENYFWAFYLISLPLSAKFSFEYWIMLLKTKGKLRYNKLKQSNRVVFDKAVNLRKEILSVFQELYK